MYIFLLLLCMLIYIYECLCCVCVMLVPVCVCGWWCSVCFVCVAVICIAAWSRSLACPNGQQWHVGGGDGRGGERVGPTRGGRKPGEWGE